MGNLLDVIGLYYKNLLGKCAFRLVDPRISPVGILR
jgi:hypothetical protein